MMQSTVLALYGFCPGGWFTRVFSTIAIAASFVGMMSSTSDAQNNLQNWPDNPDWKKLPKDPKLGPPPVAILREGQFNDDYPQEKCDEYFKKRFFPDMIDPLNSRFPEKGQNPKNDPIGQLRKWLNESAGAPNPQVYQDISQNTLTYCKAIANGAKWWPPARVEAVLMIAEVNSTEATTLLWEIVGTPDKPSALPLAVRVTALTGLLQQAKQGRISDPTLSAKVIYSMVAIAKAPIPDDLDADGWRWMHGQAAEILGHLKWSGKANEVPEALLTMVVDERKDPKSPALTLHQRCQAAAALAELNYGAGFNAQPYVAGLTLLARDIRSSPHANDRRFLRARLGDVLAALTKIADLASGEAKNQANAVIGSLQADCATLDTQKPDGDTLKSMNDRSLQLIDRYLSK